MQVINCQNVNDGFIKALDLIKNNHVVIGSRVGETLECPTPVTTVYNNPTERVLFEEIRDANPFFHFMESLWMLEGRNDLAYVKRYNKRMEEYSDDGETLWGAYGYRWIKHFGKNQLDLIVSELRSNPNSRRCVLQMWDASQDLGRDCKDVPCNTAIYFKVREGKLNMTVSNRSNDVIWGTFGANVVHMSILQEYVASAIGIEVGKYYQISDSFHVYTNIFNDMYQDLEREDAFDFYSMKHYNNPYNNQALKPYKMISTDIPTWTADLRKFLNRVAFGDKFFDDPFFTKVACPLQDAWYLYKQKEYDFSLHEVQCCEAGDWALAGFDWINRRLK